jgi:hypothetical protein
MRHIVVCDLPGSTILFKLSHKRQDVQEKINEHEMCVSILSTTFFSRTFLILRTERDMIKNFYWSSCKIFVIIVRFNKTSIF